MAVYSVKIYLEVPEKLRVGGYRSWRHDMETEFETGNKMICSLLIAVEAETPHEATQLALATLDLEEDQKVYDTKTELMQGYHFCIGIDKMQVKKKIPSA